MPLFGFHLIYLFSRTLFLIFSKRSSFVIPLFGYVITVVSSRLWNPSGCISLHSIDDGMCEVAITDRCTANASQIMKMNVRSATNEIIAPNDDTTFHFMNVSG